MSVIIGTNGHIIGQFIYPPERDGVYKFGNHTLEPFTVKAYRCLSDETTPDVLNKQHATEGFNRIRDRAQAVLHTREVLDVPLVSPGDVKRVLYALLKD